MGIFRRLFGKKEERQANSLTEAAESLDNERLIRMHDRASSYSLIAVPGNAEAEIPRFLSAFGYTLLRTGSFSGPFEDLYFGIQEPSGPDNSIVQKAWFNADGHTILLDPEMVFVTGTAGLSEIARKVGGTVKAAIWERVSESVALVEVGPEGVVRQTWYCQGERSEESINEHPEIAERPDNEGLNAALAAYGLSKTAVFGEVDATLAELQG